jgi:diadenylate cyclase
LEDLLQPFLSLKTFTTRDVITNVIDILLVTFLLYRLLLLVRGTRAWRIILGIIGFLLAWYFSDRLKLNTLHWMFDKALYLGPIALVVLLLPELRTALEGFGRPTSILTKIVNSGQAEERAEAHTVEELVAAVAELASAHVGALIVIEKDSPLDEIASNGVDLHASVSAPLLGAIFYEGNPLHDGAVIVRGDSILSAACRLPLSDSQRLDQTLHMRHRAAVGVTEAFDCLAIVVSEERGTISVATEGRLRRLVSAIELRHILNRELRHLDDEVKEEPKPRVRRHRSKRVLPEPEVER